MKVFQFTLKTSGFNMKYITILCFALLVGCVPAHGDPVPVSGKLTMISIDRTSGKVIARIGDFNVFLVYGSEDGQVEYLEPVDVMRDDEVLEYYLDQSYINEIVANINKEFVK